MPPVKDIQMTKLNIGCGLDFLPNCINHDRTKFDLRVDVAHDLNVFPWPWKDGEFDEVIAKNVLEHLESDLFETLDEVWRILKVSGLVTLKLPHWRADVSWQDPTHRWKFSMMSFEQFDPRTERGQLYAHYTKRKWEMLKRPHMNSSQSSIHLVLRKIK